jgi:hypothetical protein
MFLRASAYVCPRVAMHFISSDKAIGRVGVNRAAKERKQENSKLNVTYSKILEIIHIKIMNYDQSLNKYHPDKRKI